MSKKHKQLSQKQSNTKQSFLEKIPLKNTNLFTFIIILVALLIFYKPYVFDKLEPVGGDRMASIGNSHQIHEYSQESGDRALWNPNIFCGIPIYHNLDNKTFHIDRLISKLNPLLDWRIGWFIVGAIGMFLLIRILGFPWYYSLLGIMVFLFFPHYQALIIVGHNFKIRALCALPFVAYGFIRLIKKGDLLSLSIFAITLSLQIRTKHFQIIFYTLLLLLVIGI